jgi:hypothetical protein
MQDSTSIIFFGLIVIIGSVTAITIDSYAQTSKEDIDKTLSETDSRKSFGYCPTNTDSKNILDSLGITYTLEGCPISRLYIDNWDKISETDKQLITDYLLERGYKIEDN